MENMTVYAKSNAAEAGSKMVINDFAPVPVAPLSSYHDFLHIQVSGQPGALPVWCSDIPPDQPDVPLPSADAPLPSSTVAPLLPIHCSSNVN